MATYLYEPQSAFPSKDISKQLHKRIICIKKIIQSHFSYKDARKYDWIIFFMRLCKLFGYTLAHKMHDI